MKTKQLGKSREFSGGRHCFSYCSWPPVQQNIRLLIGLNCILLCLNNNSQIAKHLLRNCPWRYMEKLVGEHSVAYRHGYSNMLQHMEISCKVQTTVTLESDNISTSDFVKIDVSLNF